MRLARLLISFVMASWLASRGLENAWADKFIMATGAQIRGKWLNPNDPTSPVYLIAPEHGGRVALVRSRVVEIIRQTEAESEYDDLAPTKSDTANEHWQLANWCSDHDLTEQRMQHLRRVVELDPEHEPAWRALGYSEIGGQWVKKEAYLASQGYVRHQGRWRLTQEIELAEQRQSLELARNQWYVKLSRWRAQLDRDKRHEALASIRQVRDPLAIEAIGRMLRAEHDRRMRLVYVEVLGQIADDRAAAALVELALSDRDEEVYYACVDQLAARMTPPLLRQFVTALKSPQNDQVNRAAIALGIFGDPSVIPPLIDALVTQHDVVTPGSDRISSTFVTSAPGYRAGDSFTSGPNSPQVTTRTAANQEVLKTLVTLSGTSFGFDQTAWRSWHALEQRRGRDPQAMTRRGK